MQAYEQAILLLPQEYRAAVRNFSLKDCEEIRLRLNRRPSLLCGGREQEMDAAPADMAKLLYVIEKGTGASMHSAAETLRHGFISSHGLRIGVCGEAVIKDGRFCGYRSYSSISIRIPEERRGLCAEITDRLRREGYQSTLIISPPGGGKTTLLREIIRCAADDGVRVGVADERGELSGGGAFGLGRCADVVSMAPKSLAVTMLLRGMNPQLIAMDEISTAEDIRLMNEICGCGVSLMATAHAKSMEDMRQRRLYRDMLEAGIFRQLISISVENERSYSLQSLQ